MTEIVPWTQPAAELAVPDHRDIDSWIGVVSDILKIANAIYDTPFVPDGLRGSPPAVAAAMLAGREMGLGIMTSLANIDVIKGKPTQKALLMRAMIQSKGHKWQDGDVSDTRAVVRGCRKGEAEWAEVTFTADQAKKAGIDLGKYPADKLYARASSRLARRMFADVIMGMPYTDDEIEDSDSGPAAEAPAIEAPKAAQRTAQRRQAPARPTASPGAPTAQGGGSPAPTGSKAAHDGLPPLPGEDDPAVPPTSPAAPEPGSTDSGPTDTDRDADGSVTRPQLTKLGAIFTEYGFKSTPADREQRLVVASTITGRDLQSSSELSLNEASALIDTLENCGSRDNLMALLAAKPVRPAAEIREDDGNG